MTATALSALIGYLCGSIPFGFLLTRWAARKDVRSLGSGNTGATNVARVAGKRIGAVVLLLDALKAALPLAYLQRVWPDEPWVSVAVVVGAFVGHVFPVWLRFRGGKGVATALGSTMVLAPWAALAGFCLWALILVFFRVSSVGSLLGGILAVAVAAATCESRQTPWLLGGLFVAILWTHRGNILRLARRQEPRV